MHMILKLGLVPAALTLLLGAAPAWASSGCPSGFQFEKFNDTYSCTLAITYQGNRQKDVDAARQKAMKAAERGFRNCAGPLAKPEFVGVILDSQSSTEFEGNAGGDVTPAHVYSLRGSVSYSCKLG